MPVDPSKSAVHAALLIAPLMELKSVWAGGTMEMAITFNRTAMELKFVIPQRGVITGAAFNRTAYGIEINHAVVADAESGLLLIAPLMELKCQ